MCAEAIRCRRQRGLTLVEVILSMVVLGIALASLASVFGASLRASVDPLHHKQALAVAEGMLHEIDAKPFANPAGGFAGAAVQANRALFDDVFDYHGFATAGVYTIDGGSLPQLSAYGVAVAVTAASLAGTGATVPAGEAALVSVTVTFPGGSVSLSSYRTAYAPDA